MKNFFVADILRKIGQLLEIRGDNVFRIRAYLKAADQVQSLDRDIGVLVASDVVDSLPGIGKDLASKIAEIVLRGTCGIYEDLKKDIPEAALELIQVPGVGPRSARLFFEKAHIDSIEKLQAAAKSGKLLELEGVREKTVKNILAGIALVVKSQGRRDLLTAMGIADEIVAFLRKMKSVSRVAVAGSFRRMRETVGDLDILVQTEKFERVRDDFTALPFVKSVLLGGPQKTSVLTNRGVQVDLRGVQRSSFGAALLYFTGSAAHNIRLRRLAKKKEWKINEYGLFDRTGIKIASRSESEIYHALGLRYIAPELREDGGEIEAALCGKLPVLIEPADIKGDFHAHCDYSDGKDTVEEMALAAKKLGYEYVCLTDHSVSLKVAGGLDKKRLIQKRRDLERVNEKLKPFRVLFGSEVEIDAQGELDYGPKILADFDLVIAAIHSGFKQTRQQLTKRVIKACQNPFVTIIAHPTGRLWPRRESYDIDLDRIFKVAESTNTALEVNAHPWRLDLNDVHARRAAAAGVRLAIGTDSHEKESLALMKFGVGLARRAWLRKEHCLNSVGLKELLRLIRK